jgi:hypothetical protein
MIDTIVIFSKCNGLTGRYQDKVEFRVANLNEYFDAVKFDLERKQEQLKANGGVFKKPVILRGLQG